MNNDIIINSRRAFTVWELLCVLLVIFLLFAMLMPALNKARELSKVAVCRSNLKQYGLGGRMYLDDNDGNFPVGANEWLYSDASFSDAHPLGCRWHDQAMARDGDIMTNTTEYRGKMWEYISHSYMCPVFRVTASSRGCENPDHNQAIEISPQNNYTMNAYLGVTRSGGVLTLSEVRDPSRVFFFGEENSWSIRPDHPSFPARRFSEALSTRALDDTMLFISSDSQTRDCFATFHGARSEDLNRGHSNVAFIDGHVDIVTVEDQLRRGINRNGEPEGSLSLAWASRSLPNIDPN